MPHPLIHFLNPLKGHELDDAIDVIETAAHAAGFSVTIIGHDAPGPIDNEADRLNVRIDEDFRITGFTIG
jgi:hypothetical protein